MAGYQEKIVRGAEAFLKNPKYRPYLESLDKSPLAKARPILPSDYVALGRQFRQFEQYKRWTSEVGTLADLGQLPKIAFDVITASYGASIIPLLASVQPIQAQQGIVYFKQITALNTRGNVQAGQVLRHATQMPDVQAIGYANEMVPQQIGTTQAGVLEYTANLTMTPVRERMTYFYVDDLNMAGLDDGLGNIYGKGFYGTINYLTGVLNIQFSADPGDGHIIRVEYGTNYEENGQIPKIVSSIATTDIKAEIFALGTEMGMFKSFEMQRTFGRSADDEVIADLTQEINAEVGNVLISRIYAQCKPAVTGQFITWDAKAPDGVSEKEHKLAFANRIPEAESVLINNAGRGTITTLIAGIKACALFDQIGGFKRTGSGLSGATLYGTYLDNIAVIRAPRIVADNEVICMYKGTSHFDTPAVYAPYMPLVVNGSLPVLNNVLKTQGFAAVWSGMKVVVPNFTTKIVVNNIY